MNQAKSPQASQANQVKKCYAEYNSVKTILLK